LNIVHGSYRIESRANFFSPLLIVVAIFLLHSSFYLGWLVDDAAISLTYARNLANGYGLVSQAGRTPLEGYSNPLWVGILALTFFLKIFSITYTPKILSWLAVSLAFGIAYHSLRSLYKLNAWLSVIPFLILSLHGSFIIWINCGLENGLYVLLLALLWQSLAQDHIHAVKAGLLTALLALTRPEAILLFPLSILMIFCKKNEKILRSIFLYGLSFSLVYGSYLIFRLFYFNDFFPTPFYVKAGGNIFLPKYFSKIHDLFRLMAGPVGGLVALPMLMGSIWLFAKKSIHFRTKLLTTFFLWSVFSFLLLPYDHLGWYRYASPFMFFAWTWLMVVGVEVWKKWDLKNGIAYISLSILLVGSAGMGFIISQKRLKNLPVPMQWVAEKYGNELNGIAEDLEISQGKILVPDIGGTIYVSELQAHDFIGLIDKKIALTYEKDSAAFTDYIFDSLEIDIIGAHDLWLRDQDWLNDPRLQHRYRMFWDYREGDSLLDIIWVHKKWVSDSLNWQRKQDKWGRILNYP
jgi:hypothetical protein